MWDCDRITGQPEKGTRDGERQVSLPDKWSDWHLMSLIGEGSCGKVYRASNREGVVSAVKIMEIPADSFEMEALTRLKGCPCIVEVEDYYIRRTDDENWTVFLRMECLKSLQELLKERPLTEEEALNMMTDLCRGLERCEQAGILHGDVKPGNILITPEGRAKLGDFGISRELEKADESHAIRGTFACMAPESFHGEKQDQRTDIYSLGMVFYQVMNGGREPFVSGEKETAGYREREKALKKRMSGERLPAPEHASAEFGKILCRTCAFRPERRYQNASELRRALERCQRNRNNRLLAWIGGWGIRMWTAASLGLAAMICAVIFCIRLQIPLLEYRNPEGKLLYRMSRSGTLILDGEDAAAALRQDPDWPEVRNRVKKLVVQGDVRVLDASGLQMRYLEHLELPEGLEKIGHESFMRCERLREIQFPSSLKEIENYSFSRCRSLERVIFQEGMETIGYSVFAVCPKLVSVELPVSVKTIDNDAFQGSPWLEAQAADGDYLVVNGILLDYTGGPDMIMPEELKIRSISRAACRSKKELRSVILADTVEEIGDSAFFLCTSLVSVTLPKHLKELPDDVFSECESLEQVVMPEGLEKIGKGAFYAADRLEHIDIPDTVTYVGDNAFAGTPWYSSLMEGQDYVILNGILLECLIDEPEIVLPEELGIRYLGDGAFENKKKLRKIVLPDGVLRIGDRCFFNSRNLEEIVIPESVIEIGTYAMSGTRWEP